MRGIGPSLAAMLAADGLHVVADLLRVAPERVHDAVSTAASTRLARESHRRPARSVSLPGDLPALARHHESLTRYRD